MAPSTTGKFLGLGEAIFRVSSQRGERLVDANTVQFFLGGTELNVAANLKSLGGSAKFATLLPEGPIGDLIKARIHRFGVELQEIARSPGDAAWYLLEQAPAPRGDTVLTRQKSVFGQVGEVVVDWKNLFKDVLWFHTSGVTAGLSLACTSVVNQGLALAKENGLKTSYDLNFRKNLWSQQESHRRQTPFLPLVDDLVLGPSELQDYFGVNLDDANLALFSKKQKEKTFIVPRRSGALANEYWIEVWHAGEVIRSKKHLVESHDRIGVGDSMFAGWVFARQKNWDLVQAVDYAAACGALKYSIVGDQALLTSSEVESFLAGGFQSIRR